MSLSKTTKVLISQMDFSVPTFFFILIFLLFIKIVKGTSRSTKLPPGPWKLPIVGSVLHLVSKLLPHYTLKDLAKKHGPIMHLQLGQISAVVVSSPRLAREVMKTHDHSTAGRPVMLVSEIVAYNNTDIAFAPYGDYWRQMRKICTLELLSAKKVRSFRAIREEEVWNLVGSIRSSSSGSPSQLINLTEMIFKSINSIICRSAFGERCKDQDSFIKSLKDVLSCAGGFDVSALFPSYKILHVVSGMRPKLEKLHHIVDQILDNIISERVDNEGDQTNDQEDLVGVLIRIKESGGLEFPITYNNIKAVILDMFLAGTDTSSTIIEWAMAEMMRNPRVMEKAQADIRQALKGKEVIHESDIKDLGYMKLVIKETLRLHPPVALVPRECRDECEIDGYTIPTGTKVIINAWAIGRDPFGAGRRVCPGIAFGLANVELPLAQLLYHFNWKLPNGMKPEDLDMSESLGSTIIKKHNLYLFATKQTPLQQSS